MSSLKFALLSGAALAAICTPVMADVVQPVQNQATTQARSQSQSATPSTATSPAAPANSTAPDAQNQPTEEAQDEVETQDEPAKVGDVVVSAQSGGIRTSIDSISYSLADDLQATTGTLADALRNVPSVDVDPQGNVSLRGDSGVTIMVDGRPSALFSGASRAQVIQQIPADRYARIEVMTNPSAAYSPDGSGGIINLITKPTALAPDAMTMGSVRVNVGDNGRWNTGFSGSYQKDRLTVSGDLSVQNDTNESEGIRLRESLNGQGEVVSTTRLEQQNRTDQKAAFGRFGVEYKLTDRTQISGDVQLMAFDGRPESNISFEGRGAADQLLNSYQMSSNGDVNLLNLGLSGRVVHSFDDQGHEWSNDLRYDRMSNEYGYSSIFNYSQPVSPRLFQRTDNEIVTQNLGFTSAYVRPFESGGSLRLGYEFSQQRPDQDTQFRRGASEDSLELLPNFSNRFDGTQTVHALYGTYERPLTSKLTVQGGLRLEQADLEIADRTGGLRATQDYFKAYPTGHLQYQLSDTQTLRASYSRRIQRPQLSQLNPFVSYQDEFNRTSGNPNLRPQETDAIEAMWQLRKGQNFYQATAYYRDTDKAFSDVASDIGNGVFLVRPENLGSRRDIGLSFNASGRLHPTLRYSAGANIAQQEIDPGTIAGGSERDDVVLSGRLSLSWQPTEKDFVQLSGFWQGDSLLAQGTREAGGMVNLGYRRKLNDKLSLNLTGRDLFNSFGGDTVYETAAFRELSEQNLKLRAFHIGLTWQLGNNPTRPPEQFNFSTGPN